MRRTYNAAADSRTTECLELARRLYRAVTDLAKRLDEQKSQALTVVDVFTPSGEVLRTKLRDYCERLIFKDPLGHARKTEEVLWRRGFYDVVSAAKKLRKGNVWSEADKALLSAHLAVGVGFYHHLILRLQLECNLELVGAIDFAYPQNESGLSSLRSKIASCKLHTEEVRQCAVRLIHRSLICLGDLARYRLDLDPNWNPMIATRYYKMAIAIDSNVGMPYNQLGTVAGNKNFGLDAVYHYTRCILCSESFEGAEGNLRRAIVTHSFNGNEKTLQHRCVARLLSLLEQWDTDPPNFNRINQESKDLLEDIEECLNAEKLSACDEKLSSDENSIEAYLQNCRDEVPLWLHDDMVFKIVATCLMTISKLQNKESSEVQGIVAFILALLSQLVQCVISRLQESVISMAMSNGKGLIDSNSCDMEILNVEASKHINDETNSKESTSDVDLNDNKYEINKNECVKDEKSSSNGVKRFRDKSKSMLTKLRRPRKRRNSSDSDASDVDGPTLGSSSDEINSDISETEEDALSEENALSDALSEDLTEDEGVPTSNKPLNLDVVANNCTDNSPDIDSNAEQLNPGTEISMTNGMHEENDNQSEEKLDDKDSTTNSGNAAGLTTNIDSCSTYEDSSSSSNTIAYIALLKKERLDPTEILNYLVEEGILVSIKICYDWLKGHPDIIRTCAKSMRTLMSRVVTLLNLVNLDTDVLLNNWNEDSVFLSSNTKLQESADVVPLPEDVDLRGLAILEHAHKRLDWKVLYKCKMNKKEETLLRTLKMVQFGQYLCSIEEVGIQYDEVRKVFVMLDAKSSDASKDDTNGFGKNGEGEHSRGKLMRHMGRLWLKAEVRALESRLRSRFMSPYLVPDHETLAKHIPAIKRLIYAKKFIIVIPSIVVSALDEMKRTSAHAREALRWLEAQLRRGSRFLRAQRPHERLPLPLIKGPKPKDKEAWLFFQIIECCHYLTQQTKVGLNTDSESPVVTLLTCFTAEEKKLFSFSPEGLAKSAGVNIEHIESFQTKWKASSKSHG
ncbi:protein SMG5 [Orussus abietinus]|uniref:protein SMG5 n=1 Tax=Orussus abietinus TaxID=222816 RepID=UPI000625837B|nr:protein SMG5 [Orussus abietinus]